MFGFVTRSTPFQRTKAFYDRYERFFVPGMLLLGVVADFITFRAIKVETAFLILGIYATLAAITIGFMRLYDEGRISQKWFRYPRLVCPLIIQFTFGALLSASLIFYWFSGSISVSWPFLGIIALLMVSNETFRDYFLEPVVQIIVYYFALFSYFSLVFPFLLGSIDLWVFLLAGATSLFLVVLYIHFLSAYSYTFKRQEGFMAFGMLAVFLGMTALNMLNFIPPIPLSLREAGVYHDIDRSGSEYILDAEIENLVEQFLPGQTIHITPKSRVYVFSSIFAPPELNATIVHHWQWFDPNLSEWISRDKLSYTMNGGRDAGYRGFSRKTGPEEGKWRVTVETERGQVVGRIRFDLEYVDEPVETVEVVH